VRDLPDRRRSFPGDFNDPPAKVSKLTAARGGVDLCPKWGTKPTINTAPRPQESTAKRRPLLAPLLDNPEAKGFCRWLDRILGKI